MKKIIETLKTWKFWKELIIMTLGMLVGAIAVNYFLVPSKIIVGSITGLSIVLAAVFEGIGISIKVSTMIVLINAILLILAYVLLFEPLGFIVSSILFLFALINWFANSENRNLPLFAAVSVILPVAVAALFTYVIKLPLPKGLIGF